MEIVLGVRIALLSVLLLTAGCGSRAQDPLWGSLRGLLATDASKTKPARSVSEQQNDIRRALADQDHTEPLLMVSLHKRGAVATMEMVSQNGAYQTWSDATGIVITLNTGVVTSTRGLGHDILASNVAQAIKALELQRPTRYQRAVRLLSNAGSLSTQSAACELRVAGQRLIETCLGDEEFENWYGLSTALKSRQWLGRDIGYADLEILH